MNFHCSTYPKVSSIQRRRKFYNIITVTKRIFLSHNKNCFDNIFNMILQWSNMMCHLQVCIFFSLSVYVVVVVAVFLLFFFFKSAQKVGQKFTKLSKIGFCMEWFTADFLRLFKEKCQNLTFGRTAGYSSSNLSIWGIFQLNFLIS